MNSSKKLLLETLHFKKSDRPPFWFMRQAGRYLPEYKMLRGQAKNFLSFCYSPNEASEVTLQPIRRFDMDAAILFSDILVIPHMMGMDVSFQEGRGPVLVPVKNESDIDQLKTDNISFLSPVFETIKKIRISLPDHTALIGFAGSPWTVACYMVEGHGSRDFSYVRGFATQQKKVFKKLISRITETTISYLLEQIKSGAEVIQLFDSWAGVLTEKEFEEYVIEPTKIIVAALKKTYPHIPVIGFPKGAGVLYETYVKQTGVDGVSVDYQMPLVWIKEKLQPHVVVQGNLDPILLAEDKNAAGLQTKKILNVLSGERFIFNLGHGIVPHTPPENVLHISEIIKHHE